MFKMGFALIGTLEHEQVVDTCKHEKRKIKAECEEVGGVTDALRKMQADAAGIRRKQHPCVKKWQCQTASTEE
jgi:hypothetical protein